MNLLQACHIGLIGLFSDANFWFCFTVLIVATILGIKHIIGDIAFASLFTAISVMYCYTAHRVDIAEINNPKGSL